MTILHELEFALLALELECNGFELLAVIEVQ